MSEQTRDADDQRETPTPGTGGDADGPAPEFVTADVLDAPRTDPPSGDTVEESASFEVVSIAELAQRAGLDTSERPDAPAPDEHPASAAQPRPTLAEPITPLKDRLDALPRREEGGHTLSTGCPPLDALLDGGLERDAITLVFGEGGSGKTNLALQCARNVTAQGKKVAYVDTEGVSGVRLQQVFEGDPRANSDNLLLFTPYTIIEQERMVEKTALLQGVGLIVIDSINMHYRLHIEDKETEKEASMSLYKQLHHLTGHARKHGIPVLVTGQVYGGEDDTQPFARRTMEHLVKALVRFQKKPDGARKATVLKHRSIEEGRTTRFKIGPHGLEGRN